MGDFIRPIINNTDLVLWKTHGFNSLNAGGILHNCPLYTRLQGHL